VSRLVYRCPESSGLFSQGEYPTARPLAIGGIPAGLPADMQLQGAGLSGGLPEQAFPAKVEISINHVLKS